MATQNSISLPDKMLIDNGINPQKVHLMKLSTDGFSALGPKTDDYVLVEKDVPLSNGILVEAHLYGEGLARLYYRSGEFNIFMKFNDPNQINVFRDGDSNFKIIGKLQAFLQTDDAPEGHARISFIKDRVFHQGNAWW